jgi:hypothetical protein
MTIRVFVTICLCWAFSQPLLAQPKLKPSGALSPEAFEKLHTAEDTLGLLGFLVINDSLETERFAACRALITTLVRALKTENSFKYPFPRLKSVSIQAPPDSSFRIFTWQLFVNDSTYRYYGAIQMNSKELQLFPLIDRSAEMEIFPKTETLTHDKWYGVLYYGLRQFDSPEGRKYLLLGYDAYSFFEKRKVIDVLSFGKDGKPLFGANVFDQAPANKPLPNYRFLLEYSAETSARCNWDEQYQMVLIDHMIPWTSPFGRGITAVPDGSYDALRLENGRWKYVDKVFDDKQDEAPTVQPVLQNDKNVNVVGKEKKRAKNKEKGKP